MTSFSHTFSNNLNNGEMITQRAHHIEPTSIRRRYYVDASKSKFRRISTSFPRDEKSHWCNFADWKIHVVSTYFFWHNFAGRKIGVVSR